MFMFSSALKESIYFPAMKGAVNDFTDHFFMQVCFGLYFLTIKHFVLQSNDANKDQGQPSSQMACSLFLSFLGHLMSTLSLQLYSLIAFLSNSTLANVCPTWNSGLDRSSSLKHLKLSLTLSSS